MSERAVADNVMGLEGVWERRQRKGSGGRVLGTITTTTTTTAAASVSPSACKLLSYKGGDFLMGVNEGQGDADGSDI